MKRSNSMKIVAGLGSADEYIPFVEAGADEFFCGYVPDSWAQKYGILKPLNRREVLYYNVQLGALNELKILKKMIDKYHAPVHLTFNSLYYIPEQYPVIGTIIRQCMEVGFHSFIVADPALMVYLIQEQIGCNIHLSGETAEVNRGMLDVFGSFDISRVIFHRKNTIEDMKTCISHVRQREAETGKCMEFEAFILNEMCHFTGAFCNSLHCDELTHLCMVPYWLGKVRDEKTVVCSALGMKTVGAAQDGGENPVEEEEVQLEFREDEQDLSRSYITGQTGCGLCALYDLQEAGITHLKLVGRGNYIDFARQDIAALRKALDVLKQSQSRRDYITNMKRVLFPKGCSGNCYYRNFPGQI